MCQKVRFEVRTRCGGSLGSLRQNYYGSEERMAQIFRRARGRLGWSQQLSDHAGALAHWSHSNLTSPSPTTSCIVPLRNPGELSSPAPGCSQGCLPAGSPAWGGRRHASAWEGGRRDQSSVTNSFRLHSRANHQVIYELTHAMKAYSPHVVMPPLLM